MVKTITAYKTEDGEIFEFKTEAEEIDRNQKIMNQLVPLIDECLEEFTVEAMALMMCEYSNEICDILIERKR